MSSLLDRAGEGFKEQVKARAVKEFMTGDYPASAFSIHWRQICWFWRVEVWFCRYFGFERCRRIAGLQKTASGHASIAQPARRENPFCQW
ncbi:hypothetical protein ABIE52_000324 [Rhodococcus sp. OAS809]